MCSKIWALFVLALLTDIGQGRKSNFNILDNPSVNKVWLVTIHQTPCTTLVITKFRLLFLKLVMPLFQELPIIPKLQTKDNARVRIWPFSSMARWAITVVMQALSIKMYRVPEAATDTWTTMFGAKCPLRS